MSNRRRKLGVIDMETGQLLNTFFAKAKESIDKSEENEYTITKDMLTNPSTQLIKCLYKTMRQKDKIDKYGMIKLEGIYVSKDFYRLGKQSGILCEHFVTLGLVISIRGFIKKTDTSDCRTWKEVMSVLGINTNDRKKMAKMKKLLTENDVVRERLTPSKNRVFVVNPNILRNGTHVSDFCIATYKEITLNKVDKYNTYLMYLNGLLDYKDIE